MKGQTSSTPLVLLMAVLGCFLLAGSALAGPVAYLDYDGEVRVVDHPDAVDAVSALSLLASPPTDIPFMPDVVSAVPRGTKILDVNLEGNTAVVTFSKKLTSEGVQEERLAGIHDQVKWTLWNYGIDADVRILVEGTPLSDFAVPTPIIEPRSSIDPLAVGLGGHSITLSPGHGWFWNGSGWYTQRPVYCSPLNQEDFHTLEICQYLETYLAQDSMTTRLVRCTNKSYGTYSLSGKAWWQMASCYWLQNRGYPCTVYGSYSGCTLGSGVSESSDDIRARPLASDYDGSNIFISLHTNGYTGDCYGTSCPTGTITYYDCSTEHATWCTVSQNLANSVHGALISAIRTYYNSGWTDRGKANSNGNYGEIRIPDRAAILIELAFHDSCDTDAVALRDNWFRSVSAWGIYKGVCDYFGDTPTWAFYSDELVSNTIPSTMNAGETRSVSITFRNRGVLWTSARNYRLGAVGDSDPFTATTRYNLSTEVGPNATYTFTFNLTAPSTPGTYTTDWRMVRDGYTWFGATCSKSIQVTTVDPEAPTTPTNLAATAVTPTRIDLTWTASSDNIGVTGYKIFRNGGQIATSPTNSYSDTSCSANTSYTYQVSAYDAAANNSGLSNQAGATTPPTEIVIDNPSATLAGVWSTGTSATDKYGADYYFASTAVSEGKTATWRPNLAFGGTYSTYCWYPQGTNRSTASPFTVVWNGGSQTVNINQQTNGGSWQTLLTNKTFTAGTSGYVRLGNGTGSTGQIVVADAVRFVTLTVDTVDPSVPANLSTNVVSDTRVDLTWTASTDNVGVTGYRIFRDGSQIGTSAVASFSDTGCSPGNTYEYQVSAQDGAGNESELSAIATATIAGDSTPPSTPTNLSASVVSDTQISLSWTASTDNVGVAGYNIYRDGEVIATSGTTSFTDSTCSPSTTYSYQVSAFDAVSNESGLSTAVQATTLSNDTAPPTVPTELAGTAVSGTQIDLTWTASIDNVGVTGYRVFRDNVEIATTTQTSYSDTGRTPATTYSYQVSAYDAAQNESDRCAAVQVATPDTIAPTAPSDLSATVVSGTQIDLSWTGSTDNVGVVCYKIYRDGEELTTSDTTSFSDTTCEPATTYSYQVSACDAAENESTKSNTANATTPDTIAPSAPSGLSATAVSGTQIDLTWTASTDNVGVTGYKIFRDSVQIGTSATPSYSDTTCSPVTTYSYEVSAYDAAENESAKSAPAGATTPDTIAPSVPTGLSATAVSGTQVDLAWTASTDNVGVTGYKVFRGGVQIGTSATPSYSDTTCSPGVTYSYEVSAYDAAQNESAKSSPAGVTTPDTTPPTAPSNLSATAVSQTQVNLSWTASTDNVGVAGYKVFRNGQQIGTSGTTSYSDTSCDSYTSYTYTVSAYDAAQNNSALSNQANVTTPAYTDFILDNNVASFVGSWFTGSSATDKYGSDYRYITTQATETATATWTPNIDIAGYYTVYCWYPHGSNRSAMAPYTVQWNGNSQTVAVNQQVGGGVWYQLVSTKLFQPGTSGYVRLGNGTGETALSVMADAVRFLLVSDDLTAPSVPANLAATAASASQINLTWSASTDNVGVTGYRIYRNDVEVGTSATTSFSDTGLSQYTTYAYKVTAYDAMGNESAMSSPASAQTWDGQAPTVPTGLSASVAGPTRINLSWNASTDNVGVTGYKVFRGGAQIGTSATTSYSDGTCSPSTAYSYTVAAYDARNNTSAQSTSAGATTPAFATIIIDNPAATYSGVWSTGTSSTDKYGSDYKYASTAVTQGKTATWTPTISYAGNYDLYAWWPQGSNRATNAPYFCQWNGGSQTVSVNQSINGGAWRSLLTSKSFATGTGGYIRLGNGTGSTGKIVVADAVRFVQVSGN